MASHTIPASERAVHARVLAANTEDIIRIEGTYQHVEILSLDGATEIYFTLDDDVPAVVAGPECMVCPATIGSTYMTVVQDDGGTVRLIADENVVYSVQVR